MGLQTSLFQSLSGLNANSQTLSVSGNNIANINTVAFKGSRATFETQISQTLSSGSLPTANLGGSNPSQIGLGTRVATISRNFNDGSLQPTGVNTDLALEGAGFFVLSFDGATRFSRAGAFGLDRDMNMVNPDGGLVQGFGVDDDFNVVQGVLGGINIPIGTLTLAEATETVQFAGNLDASGDIATVGSTITSDPILFGSGGPAAVPGDVLTGLFDGTTSLFALGDVITITGAEKGGATLPDHTFEIGPANTTGSDTFGTTLQDLMTFMEQVLGIDTAVSGGVSLSGTGVLTIDGNTGLTSDITFENSNFVVNQTTIPVFPLNLTKSQFSDGESVRTTFVIFDSLGTPRTLDLSVVLEGKTNSGTDWRFYAQSEDDSDLDRVLGTGLLSFDNQGRLVTTTSSTVPLNLAATGAATPQLVELAFADPTGGGSVSALTDITSQISALSQDGSGIGTLEDFSISSDGTISGVFSNGLLRNIGQVVLATFANPGGLLDLGGNLFNLSSNSGNATIALPGSGRAGRIVGGALELSNVDLSEEFINLITASTGFSANSRVLSTSDQLIRELLATAR